jgi:POT family proton-dependent oligopeptide transporter
LVLFYKKELLPSFHTWQKQMTKTAPTNKNDAGFLGHPRGMPYIVGAESMDAFSFYGMQALLVLYMTKYLLLPGNADHVAGMAWFHAAVERLYGPLSTSVFASAIQGLYAGFAYLTPLAGGVLADRVLGRTRTIVLGAALMSLGHFLMAFEVSFLPALLCLLLGLGCFGSNIATQLGELYDAGDHRRADAFQLFSIGVTATVIVSPIVCGFLAEKFAWHWGFAVAGLGMLLGLALYLAGLRWMPVRPPVVRLPRAQQAKLLAGEVLAVLALGLLLPALALAMIGNQELFNAYIVWGDATYDLVFFGAKMPTSWLISLDSCLGVPIAILTLMFWRWWDRSRRPVDEITRVILGAFLMAAAPLTLAVASAEAAASGHRLGLAWGLAFHIINSVGFFNLYPVAQSLYSRVAPAALSGLMMGIFRLHLFFTNLLVGYLGGLLGRMDGTRFWLLHAGLVAGGGVLLLLIKVAFGAVLAPTKQTRPNPAPGSGRGQ